MPINHTSPYTAVLSQSVIKITEQENLVILGGPLKSLVQCLVEGVLDLTLGWSGWCNMQMLSSDG